MVYIAHRLATPRRVAASVLLVFCAAVALASDPPVSLVHPQTGLIETVDSVLHNGVYAVRHTTTLGSNKQLAEFLTSPAADDNAPRIAASPEGDLWVTWWRSTATPQVVVVKQTFPETAWSEETVISSPGESSSGPRIVHDGAAVWIAYEIAVSGVTSVAVEPGGDPNPWPGRTIVGDTTFAGDRDVTIAAESGHLWITWIDSANKVAWVEYNYATGAWSSPGREAYENGNVESTRQQIRIEVLGD